ncbi:hypothetical protein [Leucothrix pacifica]|uniref:Uncharacterized protein n=1 Tax=Leucothrix pacifica TaxID=1247513 RepID=A0A317CNY4_9GAMM|nr:hypothetical protein [Leucothrix pacifica]PWR00259.1 hypothetical protein DKW60_03720 [Leucothrix pacifica]
MEMLTFPILIVTFLLTLWLTSHIARQLHARQWKMPFILGAWVTGLIFTFASLVLVDVLNVDQPIKLALQILLPVFFTTLAFVLFTQSTPGSAFTTNVAGVFIGLILAVVSIVIIGLPIDKTVQAGQAVFNNAKSSVTSMITGKEAKPAMSVAINEPEVQEEIEPEPEPVYTTKDFLPDSARIALEKAETKVYTEPHFRNMSIFNARRAVGMRIRASWKDGKVSLGKLEAVQGGDLIVSLRRKEGVAQVPIAMSGLKKLEVYR